MSERWDKHFLEMAVHHAKMSKDPSGGGELLKKIENPLKFQWGSGGAEPRELCSDCPPVGYPTDKTRCAECPRGVVTPMSYVVFPGSENLDIGPRRAAALCSSEDQAKHMAKFWGESGYYQPIPIDFPVEQETLDQEWEAANIGFGRPSAQYAASVTIEGLELPTRAYNCFVHMLGMDKNAPASEILKIGSSWRIKNFGVVAFVHTLQCLKQAGFTDLEKSTFYTNAPRDWKKKAEGVL